MTHPKTTRPPTASDAAPSPARRRLLTSTAAGAGTLLAPTMVRAQATPGVTANEIRIGTTTSLSGPVSALGTINKAQNAYFKMLNETQGGIAGHKITYLITDDGFNPARTLEHTRRLVEQEEVAFMFGQLGTGPNSAVVKYMNDRKVPHLFLSVNGDKWGDFKTYPWTMPFAPSARTEAQIFVKHAQAAKAGAKIAILYQNDDLGRDFVAGAKDVLGAQYDSVVKAMSYEVTDPTIDSQLISLQSGGYDALILGVTGKFGAMGIRRTSELGWKPTVYIASGAATVASAIIPAGVERAIGTITSVYTKDPADAAWADDPGMKTFKAFMAKWYPEGNPEESYNAYGYMTAIVLQQLLEQCKGNFSRASILAQANNLRRITNPMLLDGITVNTSPTDHRPLEQMQLQRWDGKVYRRFGSIFDGAAS